MLLIICVRWKILICTVRLNSLALNDATLVEKIQDLFRGREEIKRKNDVQSFEHVLSPKV